MKPKLNVILLVLVLVSQVIILKTKVRTWNINYNNLSKILNGPKRGIYVVLLWIETRPPTCPTK